MLIMSIYADVVSHRSSTVRLHGVIECCSIYFLVTGVTGICGAASHRRGLIITFLIMSIHAAFIFVPTTIVTSSFDIHFYNVSLSQRNLITDYIDYSLFKKN